MTIGPLPHVADGIGESATWTGIAVTAFAVCIVLGGPLIVSLSQRLLKRGLVAALALALAAERVLSAESWATGAPLRRIIYETVTPPSLPAS